jgi:glycosyltransferase involved in cell wall biosynthesis
MRPKPGTRVSIGLPVYNGARYLAATLDSILAQTYKDFELIISDNASTDGTAEICQAYSARDARIFYYRNEINLGLSKNYSRVFELSSSEYFRWATYDDLIAPEFLAKCVAVLDSDPSVVLVHSKSSRIDEHGAINGTYDYQMNLSAPEPHKRFHDLVTVRHSCNESLGLMRANILSLTPLQGNYVGSDRTLMAELGLRGRIHIIPEYLFLRRDHPQTGSNLPLEQRASWFDPSKSLHPSSPNCREIAEYFMSVRRVSLRLSERGLCYMTLARYALARRKILMSEMSRSVKAHLLRWKLVRYSHTFAKRSPRQAAGAVKQ